MQRDGEFFLLVQMDLVFCVWSSIVVVNLHICGQTFILVLSRFLLLSPSLSLPRHRCTQSAQTPGVPVSNAAHA